MVSQLEKDRLSPGWHYDEDTDALIRDVIHRMGRRCHKWDYSGRGTYLLTMTLSDRPSRALGRRNGIKNSVAI